MLICYVFFFSGLDSTWLSGLPGLIVEWGSSMARMSPPSFAAKIDSGGTSHGDSIRRVWSWGTPFQQKLPGSWYAAIRFLKMGPTGKFGKMASQPIWPRKFVLPGVDFRSSTMIAVLPCSVPATIVEMEGQNTQCNRCCVWVEFPQPVETVFIEELRGSNRPVSCKLPTLWSIWAMPSELLVRCCSHTKGQSGCGRLPWDWDAPERCQCCLNWEYQKTELGVFALRHFAAPLEELPAIVAQGGASSHFL